MSNPQDGTFHLGETWSFVGTVRDSRGQPLDIEGATVRLRIARDGAVLIDLATPGDGDILDAAAGSYRFDVTPAQQAAAAITSEVYQYEVKVDFLGGLASIQNIGRLSIRPSLFA